MEELNIIITKTFDDHFCVQPRVKGKYDAKSFWAAHIIGVHPKYGFDQKFIQEGDDAYLEMDGMYVISCDFVKTYIIVEENEYRLSDYNEVKTLLTMWG